MIYAKTGFASASWRETICGFCRTAPCVQCPAGFGPGAAVAVLVQQSASSAAAVAAATAGHSIHFISIHTIIIGSGNSFRCARCCRHLKASGTLGLKEQTVSL